MTAPRTTKFFFHVVSHEIRHHDENGTELASIQDAYLHAQTTAKWLVRDSGVRNGFRIAPPAYLEIESECGRIVLMMSVAHLLAAANSRLSGAVAADRRQKGTIDLVQYRRLRQRATGRSAPLFTSNHHASGRRDRT